MMKVFAIALYDYPYCLAVYNCGVKLNENDEIYTTIKYYLDNGERDLLATYLKRKFNGYDLIEIIEDGGIEYIVYGEKK